MGCGSYGGTKPIEESRLISYDGSESDELTRNAPQALLQGELRFPNNADSVRGDLFHSPLERSALTLRVITNICSRQLSSSVAELHIMTTECRYVTKVQIEVVSPLLLQLHLLGRPLRIEGERALKQKYTTNVRYRQLSVLGQSPVWRAGMATDMTEEGLGLIVRSALLPGQTIEIGMPLIPAQQQAAIQMGLDLRTDFLPLPSHVHNCVVAPNGQWRVGASFTALTLAERLTLRQILAAQTRVAEAGTPDDEAGDVNY